jgi:hypothetical protein
MGAPEVLVLATDWLSQVSAIAREPLDARSRTRQCTPAPRPRVVGRNPGGGIRTVRTNRCGRRCRCTCRSRSGARRSTGRARSRPSGRGPGGKPRRADRCRRCAGRTRSAEGARDRRARAECIVGGLKPRCAAPARTARSWSGVRSEVRGLRRRKSRSAAALRPDERERARRSQGEPWRTGTPPAESFGRPLIAVGSSPLR